MRVLIQASIIAACLLPTAALAQSIEDDEKFDLKIRNFGHATGQVYQCRTTNEERTRLERNALNAFTGISRLFGSDRAFAYAAAFGAGATDTLDKSKCAEYTKRLEEIGKRARSLLMQEATK